MTTSKDKTSKISPIVAGTTISTTTTKDEKTTSAPKAATAQHTKATDDIWQKRVGAAHKMWSKLSESELKKSAGEPAKLAELVQTRYSISRTEADKQVKNFIGNRS
jgi:hypothetical protein